MALSVEITRTLPLYPRGVFLQWDLKGVTETGSYAFTVSRSENPTGPWTPLATAQPDIYNLHDTMPLEGDGVVNQLSLTRGFYYRVQVTSPGGASVETVRAVEAELSPRHRLVKRKFLRDQTLLLSKHNGLKVAVLKRMHWGPRCTKCYDAYARAVVRTNCTTCYGTSYMPGYFTPVYTLAKSTTPVVEEQLTEQGLTERATAQIQVLNYPHIEKDDILVFLAENRRFIVHQPIPGKLMDVTIFQRLVVMELPRSDIEYRIPVDPVRVPPLF